MRPKRFFGGVEAPKIIFSPASRFDFDACEDLPRDLRRIWHDWHRLCFTTLL